MPERKNRLSRMSDSILRKLADLKATEERKREADISSPEFHRLAEEVTAMSRDIMRTAESQEAMGNSTDPQHESIDEVAAGQGRR